MRKELLRCADVLILKVGIYGAFGVRSCISISEAVLASPDGVRMYERCIC